MRLVFMGTPDFSVAALRALVVAGHEVAAVYSQPPRRSGRGQAERPSPVHAAALEMGLEVRTPVSLKEAEEQARFAALEAEIAVVVAYGLLLPQAVLDAPREGCLNIHASLLPRWRGAAPIQRAIMAGDRETGVAIMQMEAGLDTGPVRKMARIAIAPDETAASLHDRLMEVGAAEIVSVLADLSAYPPAPQPDDGVTYAAKIDKAEARIDWTRPADEIDRQIRGLSPFPGAWTEIGGDRVKLLLSEVVEGAGASGEVLDDAFTIAAGESAVRVLRAQRAGKGAQESAEFLRGVRLVAGDRVA